VGDPGWNRTSVPATSWTSTKVHWPKFTGKSNIIGRQGKQQPRIEDLTVEQFVTQGRRRLHHQEHTTGIDQLFNSSNKSSK
jgi:hypothetical protein